jgi:hypothetical protein
MDWLLGFLATALAALLFSPFLVPAAFGSFVASPFALFPVLKEPGWQANLIASSISTILLLAIVILVIRKQFMFAAALVGLGMAVSSFQGYLPILLNLPRDLSGDGITLLFLPLSLMLLLGAGAIGVAAHYSR